MSVLESEPPPVHPAEVEEIAASVFGLHGRASERDQTFLLENGSGEAVLKISNSAERAEVLDLEEAGKSALQRDSNHRVRYLFAIVNVSFLEVECPVAAVALICRV